MVGGFSGATSSSGGNIAVAEYLERNRILVENPLGGAPMAAPGEFVPVMASPDSPDTGAVTALILGGGDKRDELLSSA